MNFQRKKNVILGNDVQIITELLTGPKEYNETRHKTILVDGNFNSLNGRISFLR